MTAGSVIVIDNFDSFTFNLVYDLEALGQRVSVYRNDTPLAFLLDCARDSGAAFVLSPGPGAPEDAGVCVDLVRAAAGRFGVLGVCLGHQAIVVAFGGLVGPAPEAVHGRASRVAAQPHPLFAGFGPTLTVARYHSLVGLEVPDRLDTIAATEDGLAMAVVHRSAQVAGVQFHPESILTADGRRLFANALDWMRDAVRA